MLHISYIMCVFYLWASCPVLRRLTAWEELLNSLAVRPESFSTSYYLAKMFGECLPTMLLAIWVKCVL